jgi:glyoxylase-like metal-dependent hydrolase (beta-lactamase superfamily II)
MNTVIRSTILTAALLAIAAPARPQQIDILGNWSANLGNHEERPLRGDPGVEVGEYVGMPINEAGLQKAEAWMPTLHSLLEWQGRPHPVTYSMRAPAPNFRLAAIIDPRTQQITAYTITNLFGRADRVIWMDGRKHPSKYAEHLWQGFSTGEWLPGGVLKVTTTHIKHSFMQRNGLPISPYATMTEFYSRHGDYLSNTIMVNDPVYLTETFVRSATYKWDPTLTIPAARGFEVAEELPSLQKGQVPAYPLGTKHHEYADTHKLPFEASQGGAQTQYPEYARRLAQLIAGKTADTVPARAALTPVKTVYDDGNVEVVPVQGNVHLVAGSGANITVQVDPEGVMLVDASVAAMSEKVLAAVKSISPLPIRHILNTSSLEHHTGGNEALSNAGLNFNAGVGGPDGREPSRLDGAPVIAHERVLHRMSGLLGEPAREPFGVWPHDTFYTDMKQLYFGGEVVEMLYQPAAITDGDLIVWFRRSDVVAAGDVLSTVGYPRIDLKRGGSVQGVLNALNRILDIAVPEFNNQGGTLIVPGHGRICNESDVAEYRDMITIVRDRIKAMVDKGMTLDQVKAAGPAKDYDPMYSTKEWTTDMWVETVYADLTRRRAS